MRGSGPKAILVRLGICASIAWVGLSAPPAAADCAAPTLRPEPRMAPAGARITIVGEHWFSECNDTSTTFSCQRPGVSGSMEGIEIELIARTAATGTGAPC